MLRNLKISHYALIDALDIDFTSGYSVITGETGAGKSIMLGAMGLLMGERADVKAIRSGEKKCAVEASFGIENLKLQHLFEAHDIDYDDECILRREISSNGKSRAFINDTPVQLSTLKAFASQLIDIHSQHKNLLLQNESFLIDLLDTVAENATILADYNDKFSTWTTLKKELETLRTQSATDQSEADYLSFQLEQIDALRLQDDEQQELEDESELLSHAEDIKTGLFAVNDALDGETQSVLASVRQMEETLRTVARVYSPASELAERMSSIRIELKDIAGDVNARINNMDYDPARLAFINERLQSIYDLEKKHHVTSTGELLAIAEQLRTRLNSMESIDEVIAEKEQAISALEQRLIQLSGQLHERRQAAAATICTDVTERMSSLGMPNVSLRFELSDRKALGANGGDNVDLLFSANKNVPLRSAAQIASGGEIARLMLSLKTIISRSKNLPTVVFDEIDTGVSGMIAEKMALAMQEMSEHCQVICITHLPQIAAKGDAHYWVHKEESQTGTTSDIRLLTQEERITEIAKMLSGEHVTDAAIENAKSLLMP